MSAATQEAHSPSGEERVARALLLLREALEIIDSLGEHPELGAILAWPDPVATLEAQKVEEAVRDGNSEGQFLRQARAEANKARRRLRSLIDALDVAKRDTPATEL